jgi:hypothetical protein
MHAVSTAPAAGPYPHIERDARGVPIVAGLEAAERTTPFAQRLAELKTGA